MLEILQAGWDLVLGLCASVWGVVVLVAAGSWDVLGLLHETAPRLEGLIIGVALAWVMLRRDKHPLLRVLSAPLKLIVDILDLAFGFADFNQHAARASGKGASGIGHLDPARTSNA